MTKARTKAARRRRDKSAGITMPGGAVAPQPRGKGRTPQEDARKPVLAARERHGVKPEDSTHTMAGCEVGRCILALRADASLWQTWRHMLAVHWNYARLYLGTTGQPRIGALQHVADKLETDQSLSIDPRTHAERVEAAKRAQEAFRAATAGLPTPLHRWALRDALTQREGICWANGAPTGQGRLVVQALGLIAGR